MSLSPELTAAIAILKEKSCLETPQIESETDRATLRQNIRLVSQEADWENIGICADNAILAVESIRQYLAALGYQNNFSVDVTECADKPVYLKFNTQTMTHYLNDYEGTYRGVLIAIQSEIDELQGTYGHFPLDLFA